MYVAVVPLKRLPGSFQYFTYAWGEELGRARPGLLVMVPWRTHKIMGLVWRIAADIPAAQNIKKNSPNTEKMQGAPVIKKVVRVINPNPLIRSADILVIESISALYKVSLSTAATLFLPPLQPAKLKKMQLHHTQDPHQMQWYAAIQPTVLWYDRASLEVQYHHIVRKNIALRKQTILAFPYRSAAHHWIDTCPARFIKHVVKYDTELSQKERFAAWMRIKQDPRAVVVGEHMAVCAPTDFLGTIVIVDEHLNAHKQWDMAPRYHNRDLALMRTRACGAEFILASPTPSVETLYAARTHRYALKKNAPQNTRTPHTLIDLKNEFIKKNFTLISDYAWEKTISALRSGGSVLYVLNRRGWARVVGCKECGFIARCRVCGVANVYHEQFKELRCHHCRIKTAIPLKCPHCGGVNLYSAGTGTEKIHAEARTRLKEAHINAPLVLIDKDNADDARLATLQPPFLIIGTNAALPHLAQIRLALACIVNADRELARTEFSAQEEAFDEWWNIGEQCDELIIQTTTPESPFLNRLSLRQFDAWYEDEIAMRKRFTYPPFCGIVKLIIEDTNQTTARRVSEELTASLRHTLRTENNITIADPVTGQPPMVRGRFRYMIIIRVPIETHYEDTKKINALVPDSCKVDFNPISLFGD